VDGSQAVAFQAARAKPSAGFEIVMELRHHIAAHAESSALRTTGSGENRLVAAGGVGTRR
jgi:hypothetical protein